MFTHTSFLVQSHKGDTEDLHAEMQEQDPYGKEEEEEEEGTAFFDGSIYKDEKEASGDIVKICGMRTRPAHRVFCLASAVLLCILLFTTEVCMYVDGLVHHPPRCLRNSRLPSPTDGPSQTHAFIVQSVPCSRWSGRRRRSCWYQLHVSR